MKSPYCLLVASSCTRRQSADSSTADEGLSTPRQHASDDEALPPEALDVPPLEEFMICPSSSSPDEGNCLKKSFKNSWCDTLASSVFGWMPTVLALGFSFSSTAQISRSSASSCSSDFTWVSAVGNPSVASPSGAGVFARPTGSLSSAAPLISSSSLSKLCFRSGRRYCPNTEEASLNFCAALVAVAAADGESAPLLPRIVAADCSAPDCSSSASSTVFPLSTSIESTPAAASPVCPSPRVCFWSAISTLLEALFFAVAAFAAFCRSAASNGSCRATKWLFPVGLLLMINSSLLGPLPGLCAPSPTFSFSP
mmetsp:Transcript_6917/g.16827  ORF Transcript_6917/g.16827 Transcript_6917/m.16827 type:complete len:311 (+) Transcript_6917:1048-1980(+)